jgi:hypothetical protein
MFAIVERAVRATGTGGTGTERIEECLRLHWIVVAAAWTKGEYPGSLPWGMERDRVSWTLPAYSTIGCYRIGISWLNGTP